MLHIEYGNKIKLTRGDTARITVPITNKTTGEEYHIAAGETLKMTVKKAITDTSPIFQKVIIGMNTFHIEPKDTASLEFGKYIYDVELTTADGDVYTVIEPATFKILKEVTC